MSNSTYVNWGGGRIRVTWMPGAPIPPTELVTSVHGFCFHNGKLMLVDLHHRGGDIPGGHREGVETPEQCFVREVREEGYVEGRCTYLGCSEIDHRENPTWQPGGKYPLIGYQVYYRMDIERLLPFDGAHESRRRFFVDPADAPRYHHGWNEQLDQWLAVASAKSLPVVTRAGYTSYSVTDPGKEEAESNGDELPRSGATRVGRPDGQADVGDDGP